MRYIERPLTGHTCPGTDPAGDSRQDLRDTPAIVHGFVSSQSQTHISALALRTHGSSHPFTNVLSHDFYFPLWLPPLLCRVWRLWVALDWYTLYSVVLIVMASMDIFSWRDEMGSIIEGLAWTWMLWDGSITGRHCNGILAFEILAVSLFHNHLTVGSDIYVMWTGTRSFVLCRFSSQQYKIHKLLRLACALFS
jgi:hypothetical protein